MFEKDICTSEADGCCAG